MKYPSYLRECEIKQTISLFKTIRKRDGIEAADLFKRISLTAAYGELYLGKIEYQSFLNAVSQFLKYNNINFIEFIIFQIFIGYVVFRKFFIIPKQDYSCG